MNLINVNIGEAKLGNNSTQMKVILGSCVGIGVVWPRKEIVALCHCLLPKGQDAKLGAKFVNQGAQTLMQLLEAAPVHYRELTAFIAGGSNMYKEIGKHDFRVGELNSAAALYEIKSRGIKLMGSDLGGEYGRLLIFHGDRFEFEVRDLKRDK